jgi:hypothetical protein
MDQNWGELQNLIEPDKYRLPLSMICCLLCWLLMLLLLLLVVVAGCCKLWRSEKIESLMFRGI